MRTRSLIIAFVLALGSFLVVLAPNAQAAFVGLNIEVFVNTVSQGTATGGGATLDVNVVVGDTVTFLMKLNGAQSENTTSYATTVTADDPTEIDYSVGSGNDLSGNNFAGLKDPDTTLPDPTGDNQVNSTGADNFSGNDIYEVDYIVQAGLNADANVDFSVTLDGLSSLTGADSAAQNGTQTANVRLNGEGGPILVPEPATLLLLGSGLAGLVGFGKRRKRR
jgi:hypothetical protein